MSVLLIKTKQSFDSTWSYHEFCKLQSSKIALKN